MNAKDAKVREVIQYENIDEAEKWGGVHISARALKIFFVFPCISGNVSLPPFFTVMLAESRAVSCRLTGRGP